MVARSGDHDDHPFYAVIYFLLIILTIWNHKMKQLFYQITKN